MQPDPGRRAALLFAGFAVFLVPWAVGLSVLLPGRHLDPDWVLVWTGFDAFLAVLSGAASVAFLRRSSFASLLATALGVALVCDAWFDVTTAGGGRDRLVAVGLAVLVELPLAVLCGAIARAEVRRRG